MSPEAIGRADQPAPTGEPRGRAAQLAVLLGGLACAQGIIVMLAWYLRWTPVLRPWPGSWPIMFNTGLGLALTGAALAGRYRGWRRLPLLAACYDVALGTLTLLEHLTGRNLGIDQLLMSAYLTLEGAPPGRVAPNAAVCWLVLGAGLLGATLHRPRQPLWPAMCGAVVVAIAVIALFGHLAGLPSAYEWGRLTAMSAATATGVGLLGVSLMLQIWAENPHSPGHGWWWALTVGLLALTVDVFAWLALAGDTEQVAAQPAKAVRATAFLGLLLAAVISAAVWQSRWASAAARALAESENRYRTMLANSPDFVVRYDRAGRRLYVNPALAQVYGLPPEELVGRVVGEPSGGGPARMMDPAAVSRMLEKIREVFADRSSPELEIAYQGPHGTRMAHYRLVPELDGAGRVVDVLALGRDVTELKRVEQDLADSEERFRLAFDDALIGMALLSVDDATRLQYLRVNDAMCGFLGRRAGELLGRPQREVLEPEDAADSEAAFESLLSGAVSSYRAERRFRHARAGTVWGLLGATLVRNVEGRPLYVLCQVEDITTRKLAEEQLVFRALHDDLTGLPNRALLLEHLGNALARSRRTGSLVAVLFLDLDDFKALNDSFGHSAGDEFLSQVAARISASVRASDIAARVGGDEFVVVCENLADAAGASVIADQIQRALSSQIPLRGQAVTAPASIGIAVSHEGSTPENLLRDADAAMYVAKNRGGRRWEPADASLHAAAMRVLTVEAELRQAVERQELQVHYQPLVDLSNGGIVAVEALLRWHHPQRGLVLPAEFVDIAEQRGLIGEIGAWVLWTACGQAKVWHHRYGTRAPSVAVNVSSRQLGDRCMSRLVDAALDGTGLPADRLLIEVTESQLLMMGTSSATDLCTMSEHGVRIAVDDFGTGYAGFDYLRRLPVHELKIDKSFVQGVRTDRTRTAITAGVVALGLNLGLTVVAEGIETSDQLDALREMGCSWGQGWLWHRALPPEEIEALLDHRDAS